jgi:capsular polysaccharide biosynthesis protein
MTAVVEPGAEREIDLGRWKQAAVERWWLVAAGLVAGVVVGAVYSLSGGSIWQASVLIAPGQAFSPNGSPVLVYQSSPRNINDIATSESALRRVARMAHVPVGDLRGQVTTQSLSTGLGSSASRGSNLIKLTVRLHKPKRAEDAANALGKVVIDDTTSRYVQSSIRTYQSKIASYTRQLASLTRVIDQYQKTLKTVQMPPFERLILVNQADNAILRQGNLNDKITNTQQQLTLAQNVEIAQIVSSAAASKTTARSRRNSILVGALIGLIAGLVAAVVVDVRARRPR